MTKKNVKPYPEQLADLYAEAIQKVNDSIVVNGVEGVTDEGEIVVDNKTLKPQKTDSKEQPWDDNNPEYMTNSEAVVTFTNDKMSLSKLTKLLKPNGPIRYMRKPGLGCRVHIGDFRQYASKHYVPDVLAGEIADKVLAKREAQREEEDRHKRKTGK